MNTFNTTLLLIEINQLFDELQKAYLPRMKPTRSPLPMIPYNRYGPSIRAVSTSFGKKIGYTDWTTGIKSYYDFVFQVEKHHSEAFLAIQHLFKKDFYDRWNTLMNRHGFQYEDRFYLKETLRIFCAEEVSCLAGNTLFFGIQLFVTDAFNAYKENRIDPNVLQQLTK